MGFFFCEFFWMSPRGDRSLPFPLPVACACPCGLPLQRLFPCLLLSGLPPFRVLLMAVFSLTLCWHLPFPGPACNWVTSRFIHLSYTLLRYCFLLYSQLQLLFCPLSQTQLFPGALYTCRAFLEPSHGDQHLQISSRCSMSLLRVLFRRQSQLGSDKLRRMLVKFLFTKPSKLFNLHSNCIQIQPG